MIGVFIKGENTQRIRHTEEGHAKTEAKVRVTQLQTRGCLADTRS